MSIRSIDRLRVLGLLGLGPACALAFYSLTQPWARARVALVWGVSRSPEAALLLVGGLAVAFLLGGWASWRGHLRLAVAVHITTGLGLGFVSFMAYRLIRDAGVSALFVPIATVRPGAGWQAFVTSALLVTLLGLIELLVLARRSRRGMAPSLAPIAPTWTTPDEGPKKPGNVRGPRARRPWRASRRHP